MAQKFTRPHFFEGRFMLETVASDDSMTYLPLLVSDQGLGDPADYNANRSHASFAEANEPNCYRESNVDKMYIELKIAMDKSLHVTDNQHAVNIERMLVSLGPGDINIESEKTGETIGALLELQEETTNENQVHPIWNGNDLTIGETLWANEPGLTTTQAHEGIDFTRATFVDRYLYSDVSGKLKKVCNGGLKQRYITKDNPVIVKGWFDVPSHCRKMLKGTWCGILFHVPKGDTADQFYQAADISGGPQIYVSYKVYFHEKNEYFDRLAT